MPTRSHENDNRRDAFPDAFPDAFNGFKDDFFAFFADLEQNNDRDWFAANKPRYQKTVVQPVSRFIAAMAPRLAKISPHFVADPRPTGGSMFRIHRDVRFSRDKRPYKEHAACQFRHGIGRNVHAPGFYVHLAPDEVLYGGGIWLPDSGALGRIRDAIADDSGAWKRVIGDRRLVAAFGGIGGDGLIRPPRGYAAEHPHIEDIKRKTFFAMKHSEPRAAASADFVDEVAEAFRAAAPLMRFLTKALDQPY